MNKGPNISLKATLLRSVQKKKVIKLHSVKQPISDAAWFEGRMQYHENVVKRIATKKIIGNYEIKGILQSAFKLKSLELGLII